MDHVAPDESINLIGDSRHARTTARSISKNEKLGFLCLLVFTSIFFFLLNHNFDGSGNVAVSFHQSKTATTTASFSLVRLGYSPIPYFSNDTDSVLLKYAILAGYNAVIEPYAHMALYIQTGYTSASYYKFAVCDATLEDSDCQIGSSHPDDYSQDEYVIVTCDPDDGHDFIVTVTGYDSDDISVGETSFDAFCIYVRREIRSLSATDLAATMDAMFIMWNTTDDVGQEMYGENYKSYSYMVDLHFFNAAWQDADHIHEGNGYLAQHVKLTNAFERSMQTIDPTVSLPYWDFTIDESESKPVYDSFILQADVFGNMTRPAELKHGFTYSRDAIISGAIPDGRWAYVKATQNTKYSELLSGYGYSRAPWDLNPSPYISRFAAAVWNEIGITLPSCKSHYKMLGMTDMMSFFNDIAYDPHSTTHSLMGGVYGCDLLQPMLEAGYIVSEDKMYLICSKWVFYLKEFYRYNNIVPLAKCEVAKDVQQSSCGFQCVNSTQTSMLANLKDKLYGSVPSDMDDDGWDAWISFICNGDGARIFGGDHLQAGSPADPSFWVIHPTLERLLHSKLLAGGFETEDWATDPVYDYVCDKAKCYEGGEFLYFDECCYGHTQSSRMIDWTTGERCAYIGETNAEVVVSIDARDAKTYSVRYIYDNFEWAHCSEDFEGLFEDLVGVEDSGSSAPTEVPSRKPTQFPTSVPTGLGDTESPTYSPEHTYDPTLRPTHRPTSAPMSVESYCTSDTVAPTLTVPTLRPTHRPTLKPTRQPSDHPLQSNDDDDGAKPSDIAEDDFSPTFGPTRRPTHLPTEKPNDISVNGITLAPTMRPTHLPTTKPQAMFADGDVALPTMRPTHRPTLHPSA